MARFVTQPALVTLGAACAVLPYAVESAVARFGWAAMAHNTVDAMVQATPVAP